MIFRRAIRFIRGSVTLLGTLPAQNRQVRNPNTLPADVAAGGRLVKRARCRWLMLAQSHLARRLFGSMVRRIYALAVATGWRQGDDASEIGETGTWSA